MNNRTYTQQEFLEIMQEYNTMDRKVIKSNLKEIKVKYDFNNLDIENQLGFKKEKINGWYNRSNPNIPTFEDCLLLSVTFGFGIKEVIQKEEIEPENNFIYSL